MFKRIDNVKEERKTAAGNLELFLAKFAWLKNKWIEVGGLIGDSKELRLMGAVLSRTASPVDLAIVADNLEYFEKKHKQYYGDDLVKALKLACLCGSRSIADFLLKSLKASYKSDGYDFILSYASASNNPDWAIDIASEMKGAKMPKEVYLLCSDISLLDRLKEIVDNESTSELDRKTTGKLKNVLS